MKTLLLAAAAVMLVSVSGCTKGCNKSADQTKTEATSQSAASTTAAAPAAEVKVEIVDVVEGKGKEAVAGKTVVVHYVGTLKDGTKFDSSVDRNEKFTFNLGAGQVIKGWEQGIPGMKVGGKRKLTIPPELAYGPNAVGAIPANSTLLFEVELFDVK